MLGIQQSRHKSLYYQGGRDQNSGHRGGPRPNRNGGPWQSCIRDLVCRYSAPTEPNLMFSFHENEASVMRPYSPINVDAGNSINQVFVVVRDAVKIANGSTQISKNWDVLVIAISLGTSKPETDLPPTEYVHQSPGSVT